MLRRRLVSLAATFGLIGTLLAVPVASTVLAATSIASGNIDIYDQCANDAGTGPICAWSDGALVPSNSTWSEGDSTPQRLVMKNLTAAGQYTISIDYQSTKSGKNAYDFLTGYGSSESWISQADRCTSITGCTTTADATFAIPVDPNAGGYDAAYDTANPGSRVFTITGGTIDSVSTPTITSGTYAGDSKTGLTITFTVADPPSDMCASITTCKVAIFFGAHVAREIDWGVGSGASSVSGAPFHVSLSGIGARDNQMMSSALGVTTYDLNTIAGAGGTAAVAPSGEPCIAVAGDCNRYVSGASVAVTATPDAGYRFVGWTGDLGSCSATTNPCTVTMDQARTMTAAFELIPLYELTWSATGPGAITLGIAGGPCAAGLTGIGIAIIIGPAPDCDSYSDGTTVTLTATPTGSAVFTGWTGDVPPACLPAVSPCTVTMNQNRTIVAVFEPGPTPTPTPSPTPTSTPAPTPDPTPAPTAGPAYVAVIYIDRLRNLPGTPRTITGEGFPPFCTPVILTWEPGGEQVGTTSAAADGTISEPVTIPADAEVGDYQVKATCTQDGKDYVATTDVEVYLPPTDTADALTGEDGGANLPASAYLGLFLMLIAAGLAVASRLVPADRKL